MEAKFEKSQNLSIAEYHFAKYGLCFFTSNDLTSLKFISKKLSAAAKTEKEKRKLDATLLRHVILGEQDEAHAMIEANPELLSMKGEAVDYSRRIIMNATPFQAAIGAGDELMWEMMLPYFEVGEALRQFRQWFPKGIEDTPASTLQVKYNTIASAISKNEDNRLAVIEEFRKEITSQNEIRQGNHFNLNHLIAAYQTYIDKFDDLCSFDNRVLFWRKVISYLPRQMTAYDAQVHCSGLQSVLDDKGAFSRSFKFLNGESFFPVANELAVGADVEVYNYHTTSKGAERLVPTLLILKNYVEQKQLRLQDLESRLIKEFTMSPSNCS